MTVPRVYVQSMLLAVMCFGQLVTETASLRQALAASIPESGSDRRAEMKRGESRPTVQQLQPDHPELWAGCPATRSGFRGKPPTVRTGCLWEMVSPHFRPSTSCMS